MPQANRTLTAWIITATLCRLQLWYRQIRDVVIVYLIHKFLGPPHPTGRIQAYEETIQMSSVAYAYMTQGNLEDVHSPSDDNLIRVPSSPTLTQSTRFFKHRMSCYHKPKANRKPGKVLVEVCVQFAKVGEIDTLKEQYTADVVIKAKWREPSFDDLFTESEPDIDWSKFWNPKIYIENTVGDPKEKVTYKILHNDDGIAFIVEKRRLKGVFMENLELDDFPFDVQDLTVTVASELLTTEAELMDDTDEHHIVNRHSFMDEQEWHLYQSTESVKKNISIEKMDSLVTRSAISVKARAARRPGYFVWNIFMVTFLICSLSFATFAVKKTMPQNRLQLSFTLMLTSVAFKTVVNQSLPKISYLTYMDKYLLASMIMLSLICAWHGIVTIIENNVDEVERNVLISFAVIYAVYNGGFVLIIYIYPMGKRRMMSKKDRHYRTLMKRESKISTTHISVPPLIETQK